MANAGCINAYDCNGCLIQTLQNLDSACIGVGVQYTAPNPLDDKRLDYIKYTDKCGCVQCLSAENEILIYATNGVIKNLTLTNDDVNEAIKIKWNDIFGSNRAKTIVRYKTGSYPVSITDGTLAVEETTKNQYSSTPFSLSGVLDETTYYISAFAVDSNDTIIDVQGMSITTNFTFAGYQKVEYIKSSGYCKISTGYNANSNMRMTMQAMIEAQSQKEELLFGTTYSSWAWSSVLAFRTSEFGLEIGASVKKEFGFSLNQKHSIDFSLTSITVDGTTQTLSATTGSYEITLFYGNGRGGHARIYECKIYTGTTLMKNFIPCYRKSDNVIGMLDTVNKQFYTNSGSGSFTKGPDVN